MSHDTCVKFSTWKDGDNECQTDMYSMNVRKLKKLFVILFLLDGFRSDGRIYLRKLS